MPLPIEDYALVGDTQTAALVGRDGSIDWLCLPRFDSGACFAALLGDESHGRWLIAPKGEVTSTSRRYRGETMVLETTFETADGSVRVVDFMPIRRQEPDLVRVVEGISGRVDMRFELTVRFDYGFVVPWVTRDGRRLSMVAGPNSLVLHSPVDTHGENLSTVAEFTVSEGESVPFLITWHPSNEEAPRPIEPLEALEQTERWWTEWASKCTYDGRERDLVVRSLLTLKAMTYAPTGGLVAAPTTSLPEELGGVRNWDYRYCWIRDSALTLYALMSAGYTEEAKGWDDWLIRAVAGSPNQVQMLYGVAGERLLPEVELGWLPGYEGSAPVRIGNKATNQFQLDVFGEVMDTLHFARQSGIEPAEEAWDLQKALVDYVEDVWTDPDEGIWEVRGPKRHFTHSKVMAWVTLDRAVKAVERHGLDGPVEKWRKARDDIHGDVCSKGWNDDIGSFVQSYGSDRLDASLLMIPLVGFLPPKDPRVIRTVESIERDLCDDGLVRRYIPDRDVEGLPGGEGAFLACTLWLADNYVLQGKRDAAIEIFDNVCSLANDVGLLAEEYDIAAQRMVGNFPQAFSHLALVDTALNLTRARGPASDRAEEGSGDHG